MRQGTVGLAQPPVLSPASPGAHGPQCTRHVSHPLLGEGLHFILDLMAPCATGRDGRPCPLHVTLTLEGPWRRQLRAALLCL